MKDVFLSYKSSDFEKAASIKSALEKENISVWMAPADIPAGSSYGAEIPFAIENCQVFLLILSSAAQTSKWIPKEIDRAINEGKRIIPYMIEKCSINKEFGFFLSDVQIKEAYKNEEAVFAEILREIRAVTGKTAPALSENKPKNNIISISSAKKTDSQSIKALSDDLYSDFGDDNDCSDEDDYISFDGLFDEVSEEDSEHLKKKYSGLMKKVIIPLLVIICFGLISWVIFTFSSTVTIGEKRINKTDKEINLINEILYASDIEKLSSFENLQVLRFYYCQFNVADLAGIPLKNLRELVMENCGLVQEVFDTLKFNEAEVLKKLDISGCSHIKKILSFEDISDTLNILKISDTGITDIGFLKGNKTIEYLSVDGLGLSSLVPLEESIYLRNLYAKNNSLLSLDGIKNCTILEDCDLSGNTYLEDISVLAKSAQTLENLDISGNSIKDISALSECEKLVRLKMQDNKISSLSALSGCKELAYLDASGNEIASVDSVAGTNEFSFVDLSDNRITEITTAINFKDGGYVVFLLHDNEVESICLDETTVYENLYLHGNNISSYDFLGTADLREISVDYIENADFSSIDDREITVWLPDCPLDKQVSLENRLYKVYFSMPPEIHDFKLFISDPFYRPI